jgi:hypothetical protein
VLRSPRGAGLGGLQVALRRDARFEDIEADRLARIKDALRFVDPDSQPDILDDVLDFSRASENAVQDSGTRFRILPPWYGCSPS